MAGAPLLEAQGRHEEGAAPDPGHRRSDARGRARARGGHPPGLHSRHAVRGARLPLPRAGQRPLGAGAARDARARPARSTGRCWSTSITQKGKGYKYAEDEPVEYHGPSAFDPVAGIQKKKSRPRRRATPRCSARRSIRLAEHDPRVVAITASMPDGTGLVPFAERFPDRFLNTGIAEQHSVTLAAGLALGGSRPVVAIYSTFLQRGFDQIFHDVCLMDLPVVFALDRGGHRRQRRLDPPRAVRLRLPAHLPEHHRDGAQGRERAPAHARDRARAAAPDGAALPARQRRTACRSTPSSGAADRARPRCCGAAATAWSGRSARPSMPALEAAERLARGGRRPDAWSTPASSSRSTASCCEPSSSDRRAGARLATVEEHVGRRRLRLGGPGGALRAWSSPASRRCSSACPTSSCRTARRRCCARSSASTPRASTSASAPSSPAALSGAGRPAGPARRLPSGAADPAGAALDGGGTSGCGSISCSSSAGCSTSRERARRAVMAGVVEVDGRRVDKPGTAVRATARCACWAPRPEPFVSRGGRKLAAALDHFELDPAGLVCLDVGASTGGFTDCLLRARRRARLRARRRLRPDRPRAARRPAGHRARARQRPLPRRRRLPERLRPGRRRRLLHLGASRSCRRCCRTWRAGGRLLALIKPQFEVGRGARGQGADRARRGRCAGGDRRARARSSPRSGSSSLGTFDSPVAGAEGNRRGLRAAAAAGAARERRARAGRRGRQARARRRVALARELGRVAGASRPPRCCSTRSPRAAAARRQDVPALEAESACDLMVVLGGDGTLLLGGPPLRRRAADPGRQSRPARLPDRGRRAEASIRRLVEVLAGRYAVEPRSLLDVELDARRRPPQPLSRRSTTR